MENETSKQVKNSALHKTNVVRSVWFWIYIISKATMLMTVIYDNWLAFAGFCLAMVISYYNMMSE